MGYEKSSEMKIIRIKHRVSLSIGIRKIDLMQSLYQVPSNAIIDDLISNNGIFFIEFHEDM